MPGIVRHALIGVVVIVVGCSSTEPASVAPGPSGQPAASPVAPSLEPEASIDGPARSSTEPTSSPAATPLPSPTPRPAAWTKPGSVGLDGCLRVTATIDTAGAIHLAGTCRNGSIGYATSRDGSTWTATIMEPPANRLDTDAQVAFSGGTLYLAWTRQVQLEGACGDDGLADVGVNVRTRTLPDGAWSAARRIGEPKDHLQGLRVDGATIHATVLNQDDRKTWYEAVTGDRVARTLVPGVVSRGLPGPDTAIRIGNDGVARIAYAASDGIRYGTVDGSGVQAAKIPGGDVGSDPVFALAGDGSVSIFWTRYEFGGHGCAEPEPPATDGTYFATNAGGRWKTEKVSDRVGGVSATIDSNAGMIYAVLEHGRGLDYLERPLSGGAWRTSRLPVALTDTWVTSPAIRQDPVTGRLRVFFVRESLAATASEESWSVEAMQR